MAEAKRIRAPFDEGTVASLRAGDQVLITGKLIGARDAAHKRLIELMQKGEPLPIDIKGAVVYYVGPTPPKPGEVIGAAGPTTSGRMDRYAPTLLAAGLKGMIGKGYRNQEVKDAIVQHKAAYLVSVGGAGALISKTIKAARVIAWEELGTEALREFEVEDFPAIVIHDMYGGDLYTEGQKQYQKGAT